MREDLKHQGYSKEDEYFHRKDMELIRKLREKSAAQRAQRQENNRKQEYWMRCPKCGSTLVETDYGNVLVDRCPSESCGGIFFDGGELEILLKAKNSLLSRIFGR